MDIKPFTFVAATTRPGLLSSPLRSRFGILLRLEFYTDDELRFVVERSADVLGVPIDHDGAAEIAMRSRGTPRIAKPSAAACPRLRAGARCGQDRPRDGVQGAGAAGGRRTASTRLDRRLLRTIIEKYDGGPVGAQYAGCGPG